MARDANLDERQHAIVDRMYLTQAVPQVGRSRDAGCL